MDGNVSVYRHVLFGVVGERLSVEVALTARGKALVAVELDGALLAVVHGDEESGNRRALARIGDSLQEAYGYAGRALRADRSV